MRLALLPSGHKGALQFPTCNKLSLNYTLAGYIKGNDWWEVPNRLWLTADVLVNSVISCSLIRERRLRLNLTKSVFN